jgi:hypothetical protein
MKTYKRLLLVAFLTVIVSCLFCQPAFAISESEVQAQVDAVGKEEVSGNVLIWFLCAIAFLKVSQKIDSFMSSLGINVGHTGGSMLAEALIATRGLASIRNFSNHHFGGGRSSGGSTQRNSGNPGSSGGPSGGFGGGGFMSGGLAGVVSRHVTNSAIRNATSNVVSTGAPVGSSGGIGSRIFNSSVQKGSDFANNVIGTVAQGSISSAGSITGQKAAEALHSYMGYAALEKGAENIPAFSNVEIGGGRITGTETTAENPGGISFGMYHTGQYAAPEGSYTTVQAADGSSWYKQYAKDTVEKSPYMAPDGSIAYHESIVNKLPNTPRRKDKI